jgi:hypothetical protein
MSQKVVKVRIEDALDRLQVTPDYDPGGEGGPRPCVHSFRTGSGMMLGAHWDLERVRVAMEEFGCEEAGPHMTAMHHGLVFIDKSGPVFLETKPRKADDE